MPAVAQTVETTRYRGDLPPLVYATGVISPAALASLTRGQAFLLSFDTAASISSTFTNLGGTFGSIGWVNPDAYASAAYLFRTPTLGDLACTTTGTLLRWQIVSRPDVTTGENILTQEWVDFRSLPQRALDGMEVFELYDPDHIYDFYASLVGAVLGQIQSGNDTLRAIRDPLTMPAEYLPYAAASVALNFDDGDTEGVKRNKVGSAVPASKLRGTEAAAELRLRQLGYVGNVQEVWAPLGAPTPAYTGPNGFSFMFYDDEGPQSGDTLTISGTGGTEVITFGPGNVLIGATPRITLTNLVTKLNSLTTYSTTTGSDASQARPRAYAIFPSTVTGVVSSNTSRVRVDAMSSSYAVLPHAPAWPVYHFNYRVLNSVLTGRTYRYNGDYNQPIEPLISIVPYRSGPYFFSRATAYFYNDYVPVDGDTLAATIALSDPSWAASTAYIVGNRVVNGVNSYICVTAGTSAGSGGPTGTGAAIADNTAVWDFYAVASTTYTLEFNTNKLAVDGYLRVSSPVHETGYAVNPFSVTITANAVTAVAITVPTANINANAKFVGSGFSYDATNYTYAIIISEPASPMVVSSVGLNGDGSLNTINGVASPTGGTGYSNTGPPPKVVVTATLLPGVAARLPIVVASVSGGIVTLTQMDKGLGMAASPAPTMALYGGAETIVADVRANSTDIANIISGFEIVDEGAGYGDVTDHPLILTGGDGTTLATGTYSTSGGVVSTTKLTHRGFGYTIPPTVTLNYSGTAPTRPAVITATVRLGALVGLSDIMAGGSTYVSANARVVAIVDKRAGVTAIPVDDSTSEQYWSMEALRYALQTAVNSANFTASKVPRNAPTLVAGTGESGTDVDVLTPICAHHEGSDIRTGPYILTQFVAISLCNPDDSTVTLPAVAAPTAAQVLPLMDATRTRIVKEVFTDVIPETCKNYSWNKLVRSTDMPGVNRTNTTLSAPLTNSATTVNVVSTTGFTATGSILIEQELISYTGLTGTSFTTCTRGTSGTAALAHASGIAVSQAESVVS